MKALLFAVFLMIPLPLWAADPVGIVLLAIGQAEAVDAQGEARVLQRKSPLYHGDLLRTGAGGRLQVRFTDGGLVAMKSSSEFRIAEYSFDEENREQDSAVFELLKGGMRTVTGQIGKQDRADYSVRTVVATIGIRGTHYELQLCDAGCASQRNAPRGLVGRVLDGRIHVSGQSDAQDIPKGKYFSLPQVDGSSVRVSSEPPAGFVADGDDTAVGGGAVDEDSGEDQSSSGSGDESSSDQSGADSSTTGDQAASDSTEMTLSGSATTGESSTTATEGVLDPGLATSVDTQVIDSTAGGTLSTSSAGFVGNAPSGSMVLVAMTEQTATGSKGSSGDVTVDGNNQILLSTVGGVGNVPTKIYYEGESATDCQPCTFDSGSATLSQTGGSALGVNWGRWSGGFSLNENGVAVDSLNFDYIYSDKITPLSVISAKSGVLVYNYVGGTDPITENGLVGTSTSGSVTVDFGSDSVTAARLDLSGFSDGRLINLSLDSAQTLSAVVGGDTLLMSGSCSGGGPCASYPNMTGEMSMTFVGSNADAIISSYGASGNNGTDDITVSGTALLQP
ncbi:FecR domain-containing protein [Marinobacterium sp. D7]|uniref:FecR domain-containing protein n=1 Tax=Marinobacterium ramblicola TaxID=2849041 RepID=UPI001C2D15B5|nr:FecR domain-containing protein [Marinobacterium ramblicola]MBV1788033.1 FecR domain-containing protein [Marinobacterium ramblicola]